MKSVLLAGVAAIAVCAGSSSALAQDTSAGWYVAADIGWAWSEGIDMTSSANGTDGQPLDWTVTNKDGLIGTGRLGYEFGNNWRLEFEGGYRKTDIKSVLGSGTGQPVGLCSAGIVRTAAAPTCGPPAGELRVGTAMANVLYDFMPGRALRPFVGVGADFAEVHNKVYGQLSGVPAGGHPFQDTSFDDIDRKVAYQGLIGLAYELSPNLSLDLTARHTRTGKLRFNANTQNVGPAVAVGTVMDVGTFRGRYSETTASVGLRYTFGAAPPPPPPPAAAYEARQFVVYFPFDQYVLTPEAQTVVSEAANYAKSGNATRVVVVGHADTSGSLAYNVRLSERRAKAVADALVGSGVAQTTLSVDWKGETMPAVATGDGVKEPLNRRSSIDINF